MIRSTIPSLIALILFSAGELLAQPGFLGTDARTGSYETLSLTSRGAVLTTRFQAASGASGRKWELPSNVSGSANYQNVWRPYDNSGSDNVLSTFNARIDPATATASARYNSNFGGATGSFTTTTSDYYTWNIGTNGNGSNNYMAVLQTTYNPISITSVTPSASAPNSSQVDTITVTLSGSKNSGEHVYIRYTTNSFTSSTYTEITSFNGSNQGTMTIPAQTSGTTVQYYALDAVTSSPADADIDYLTLNVNNN